MHLPVRGFSFVSVTRNSWRRLAAVLVVTGFGGLLSMLPIRTVALAADPPKKAADNPALQAASVLYEGIRTETLPNGLRVFLKPIPGASTVTTMVAYKVGSSDENLDSTGLSHYLEHLMFKGTDKIKPGDIDRQTLINGGANNAYTSEDATIYHFDFAADRWEVALEIEADRMQNLRIDEKHEFEQEKGAVCSELDRNEDEPWDLELKAILPMLFGKKNPYGHPVIGERKHVEDATAEIIKSHYDKWYHPNNASLVICGGFDADKAMAKINELFGPIPKAKLPERKTDFPLKRTAVERKEMDSKFDVPRLLMGYNTVRSDHPDYFALTAIEAILSGGKTSRLYKKLVEGEEVAGSASAGSSCGRYPGWFYVQVELLKGKDRKKVEDLVLAEMSRLAAKPVNAEELNRVKQQIVAAAIFNRESVHGLADSIAQGVTINDLDFLKNYLPRVMALTAEDVQKVAKKYFDPEARVVVWSLPKADKGDGKTEKSSTGGASNHVASFAPSSGHPVMRTRQVTKADTGSASPSLSRAQRVELPNGLVLLLMEEHRLPIVVAQATVRNSGFHEPEEKAGVATLMGNLLDEGTSKHTGPQIAEMIEDVGGILNLNSAGGSVRVLTPQRSLGLGLLFECLQDAQFPKDAFAREREKLLNEIDDAEQRPDLKARMTYRKLVYGKHPLGRPSFGTRPTVEKLTPEDCVAFHKQVFVPNNTIVAIVGDFDSKEVIAEVKKLTADWKKGEIPKLNLPAIAKPEGFTQKVLTMVDASQLHFYMGHTGIRRDNPDFFKLHVMDYVLGTGPGFTDRLSSRLRDREGLAYTVSANITSGAGEEPGLFTCYIGTEPGKFAKVKSMFLEELKRIRDEKPTDEEVENAKKYLLGSMPFQVSTNEHVAAQLLMVERYKLGLNYLEDYRKAVAAVTPADVQAVAKKHLDPDNMVLVVAGAVDGDGKVLNKAPAPK
jgi:zinc protease